MRDFSYLLLLTCVFLVSCQNRKENKDLSYIGKHTTIDINKSDISVKGQLSNFITIDSIVFLEDKDNFLIGDVWRIRFMDDYIYILDKNISKSIFCFTKEGKAIGKFNKTGKGKSEYLKLYDFDIYNNKIYLTVDKNRIFVLNKELELLEVCKVRWNEKLSHFFNVIDENTFVLADADASFKLNIYSRKEKKMISQFFPLIKNDYILPGVCSLQEDYHGRILFNKQLNDTIYYLSKDLLSISPYFIVNFQNGLSLEEKRKYQATEYRKRNIPINVMTDLRYFHECDDFISFSFVYNDRNHHAFKDKLTGKMHVFPNNITDDLIGYKYIPTRIQQHKDGLFLMVDSYVLLENQRWKNKLPHNFSAMSNPAIVFFKPKFTDE